MPPTNFSELVWIFLQLITAIFPLLSALAFLAFIWGLAKFLFRIGGDEKAVSEGKALIKWGLFALFILLSFMGIIRFFYADIGFSRQFGIPFLP